MGRLPGGPMLSRRPRVRAASLLLVLSLPALAAGQAVPPVARPRPNAAARAREERAGCLDMSARLPTLGRLRAEGAFFERARVTHLPTITSVGHATIATGTDARFHGIVANTAFNRVKGQVEEAFPALSPENLSALTLTDRWNL